MDRVARGRVFTGLDAQRVGLIDEVGGLPTAVRLARESAGIAPSEEVRLITYPKAARWARALRKFSGEGIFLGLSLPEPLRQIRALISPPDALRGPDLVVM